MSRAEADGPDVLRVHASDLLARAAMLPHLDIRDDVRLLAAFALSLARTVR